MDFWPFGKRSIDHCCRPLAAALPAIGRSARPLGQSMRGGRGARRRTRREATPKTAANGQSWKWWDGTMGKSESKPNIRVGIGQFMEKHLLSMVKINKISNLNTIGGSVVEAKIYRLSQNVRKWLKSRCLGSGHFSD